MERPAYQTSDEFARVVWMAHILTYKNPYTWTAQDAPSDREDAAIDGTSDCDDESQCGDGFDEDMEDETASQDIGRLTAYDQDVREKFLDSIAELLSRSKGGKHVIATALRENEDSVEVDVARNDEFAAMDDEYLSSLTEFLALHGDGLSSQDTQSSAHKFLDTIFTYSRDRIIFWIERAARDLHDSRVSSRSPYLGLAKTSSDLCLLGCCSKLEIDAPAVTGALVWRLRFLSGVGSMTGASTTETLTAMGMRQVVELAAAALQNPEATQAALKTLVPSVDPVRITKSWRLLARPVTNLQVLFRIAKLLPNFRAATFVKIPLPPTIRLRRDQIPTISEASRILGLDGISSDSFSALLKRKAAQFKKDCSRRFPVHCEIQLLSRYEAEPGLTPSLAYFGCSKKACFLCHSFLTASPLKPRTRGRHGECHPLWGVVEFNSSESVRSRLKDLCGVIKQHLMLRFGGGTHPAPAPVQQSSAVSQLATAHMLGLRQQSAHRELAEKRAQELRERTQILLDPRSTRPRGIWFKDYSSLCIMCQMIPAKRCAGCFSTRYCSKRCQEIDWPAHKLLCSRYIRFMRSRPSINHKAGIWFPRDTERPRMVWALCPPNERRPWRPNFDWQPNFDSFLGPGHDVVFMLPFGSSRRRGLQLEYPITLFYRDWDEILSKSVYNSVSACHPMTVPFTAVGDFVAIAGGPTAKGPSDRDMSLADFRHTLDFFSTYFDDTIRDPPLSGSIRAVKVSSQFEQSLYGHEEFSARAVDPGFSCTSDVSELSRALGQELRVCMLKKSDLERDAAGLNAATTNTQPNPYFAALMINIDASSDNWPRSTFRDWDGSLLLLREDGADLEVESAQRICRYCVEVLEPLFARSVAGEIPFSTVLKEVAPDRLMAWAQGGRQDPSIER